MSNDYPRNFLFFYSLILSLLWGSASIRRDPRLPVYSICWSKLIVHPSNDPDTLKNRALDQRNKLHIVVEQCKIEDA